MGQKSNILTLRQNNESLNAQKFNMHEVLNSELFIKTLKRSFDKKGVIITAHNNTNSGNTTFLFLDVFFKCAKLIRYKKKIKRILKLKQQISLQKAANKKTILNKNNKNNKKTFLRKKRTKKTYQKFLTILKKCLNCKLIVLKLTLINKKENLAIKTRILKGFKKFKKVLFSRRSNLYYDLIKLTSLFINKHINVKTYCNILGTVFKFLPKKSHGKFFLFVKTILNLLLKETTSEIIGAKVLINGKLKGKLRASSFKCSVGKISTQTISAENDLSKIHINTLYGAFGMTMWVNYKNEVSENKIETEKTKELEKKSTKTKKTIKISTAKSIKLTNLTKIKSKKEKNNEKDVLKNAVIIDSIKTKETNTLIIKKTSDISIANNAALKASVIVQKLPKKIEKEAFNVIKPEIKENTKFQKKVNNTKKKNTDIVSPKKAFVKDNKKKE